MSFEMTRMDEKVLKFIASAASTGKTKSQLTNYFTSDRADALKSAARLTAARYVKWYDRHYVITEAGEDAL